MVKPSSIPEIKCHPKASETLRKWVDNYNWFGRNYSKLVEKFGGLSYVAVHGCEAIDNDKDLSKLQERLTTRFSREEYNSICIGSL